MLKLRHLVELLGQLFGPSQGHYLHLTTQTQKTRRHIPAPCGFRTHDSIVWPSEDGALLRVRAHHERQSWFKMRNMSRINHDASNDYIRHFALFMTLHLDLVSRSGVLMVRCSNSEVFQDVTSRSLVYVCQRFGITYCLCSGLKTMETAVFPETLVRITTQRHVTFHKAAVHSLLLIHV